MILLTFDPRGREEEIDLLAVLSITLITFFEELKMLKATWQLTIEGFKILSTLLNER